MTSRATRPITQLLHAATKGDQAARERLWSTVYDEIHHLAQIQLAGEGRGCQLQPTALVNEAYLRLVGDNQMEWTGRRHFFGAAAQAMRRILVDNARSRGRLKRGAGKQPAALPEDLPSPESDPVRLLAISEALERLERADPPRAEIVVLRYFGGLSIDETAQALHVSSSTVDTAWRFARAWLHRELGKGDTTIGGGHAGNDA